ncbi:hypothetical protein PMAC_002704 [Pneumocystis sp. 'macacae']|nr:hypothetical protein PMAC_002704 [Pneumocystis sp. 'macacae']
MHAMHGTLQRTARAFSSVSRRCAGTEGPPIPPRIASVGAVQGVSLPGAASVRRIIDLYARLPQGARGGGGAGSWVERYRARHFEGRGTGRPLAHFVGVVLVIGYLLSMARVCRQSLYARLLLPPAPPQALCARVVEGATRLQVATCSYWTPTQSRAARAAAAMATERPRGASGDEAEQERVEEPEAGKTGGEAAGGSRGLTEQGRADSREGLEQDLFLRSRNQSSSQHQSTGRSVGLKAAGPGTGKPRLTTKISTTMSHGPGVLSEGPLLKAEGKGGVSGGALGSALPSGLGSGGAVWGRNKKSRWMGVGEVLRITAAVREYTDEELSSVHGIRLARRLSAVSDEDKAGKWDEVCCGDGRGAAVRQEAGEGYGETRKMDDDGTDWSDTIEFADGTKFALPHDDHGAGVSGGESLGVGRGRVRVEGTSGIDEGDGADGADGTEGIGEGGMVRSDGGLGGEYRNRPVLKEEQLESEYYSRSRSFQRQGVPQIYNVNTGKFDVVDEEAKNAKRRSRRASSQSKPKTCRPVSLLSRHNVLSHVKDEVHEAHEQKQPKPDNIVDSDVRKRPLGLPKVISRTESKAEAKIGLSDVHSSAQPLISAEGANTAKPALYQPVQGVNPMIDDIETFQKAVMIEAKEKARLRREEEEIERKMQQERARKKAEELAKLAQKSKLTETLFSQEKKDTSIIKNPDIHSIHASNVLADASLVSSQQMSSVLTHESKISSKLVEEEVDKHDSSHPSANVFTTHSQTLKNQEKSSKLEPDIPLVFPSETDVQVHTDLKLTLKKNLPIIFAEQHPSNDKEGKTAEIHKHNIHINTKQKHSKISQTNNHSSFNDSWRKEHITANEKELHKTWVSLNNLELREPLNSPSMSLFPLEKKKLSLSTVNKTSNKSNSSHSRTSSRFFPVTTQTEITTQPIEVTKLGKNKNTTLASGHREKNDISILSKTSFDTPTHSIQTSHSDMKSPIIILPTSSHASQTASTPPSGRLLDIKTILPASTVLSSVPPISTAPISSITSASSSTSTALLITRPGSNVSLSSRQHTRPSTRSFDDVMEQLARAGNFAQSNEKFASYLSVSKSQQNHIENDILSVTTVSPFELEKYSKNTTNVSLHSLNTSNELFMTAQPFISENDTKPFVNIPPASSCVFTARQYPMERPKYFETPHEHTIDFTLYEDQEVDTLRLYLPETSPKHIKIKSSNTFLHKKSSKNSQLPVYNTLSS